MKYSLPLLLLSLTALADPSVNQVRVNIHNETQHPIKFKSFDSLYVFESTVFAQNEIPAHSSVQKAILYTGFDNETMTAGVNILIDEQPMKLMWQVNMGFGGPDESKFHICGVIKDGEETNKREYCDIPYVVGETLVVDFRID